jgi:pullulanase
VIADGRLARPEVGPAGRTIELSLPELPDGPAVLHLCLNHDGFQSFHPSFGDRFCQIVLDGDPRPAVLRVEADAWKVRTLTEPENLLTIHYHRFDGDTPSVGIWTWDEGLRRRPEQQEIFAVGRDAYGLIFQLDVGDYGKPGDRIGMLPRMNGDWGQKDGGDRFWSPDMGQTVYLVQGRDQVYTTPPDIKPQLLGATFDAQNRVTIRFTHSTAPDKIAGARIFDNAGRDVAVVRREPIEARSDGRARTFALHTARPADVARGMYGVAIPGFDPRPIRLGEVLAKQPFIDLEARLGCVHRPEATTFSVFAPTARTAELVLADAPASGNTETYAMKANPHGVWSAEVSGDQRGKFYAFRFTGLGLDPRREVTDISAICAQGLSGRGLIVDPTGTDPPGFSPDGYVNLSSPTDAIIYEMHVRDFTIADNSGVARKGTYLGLTEAGTTLPCDPSIRTGIDHLAELGVTHVQLLPIHDFENDETADQQNWGYMTVFFNTPEGMYASTPHGDARMREFKQVVQALHARGIGVILDVVYNHTSPYATFESTVPGYYHRRRPDGSYWNGSGCGNEVQTEYPMARKFIIDSLVYWVREYGVDGFRFDLMGLMDIDTMTAIREALTAIHPGILIYGEPWAAGASGLGQVTNHAVVRGTGIGAFNDDLRDAIKGDRDGGPPGFIQTGDRADRVRRGIRAASHDPGQPPGEVITYCACHDNLVTWDKIVQAAPAAGASARKRMQRFAGLIVLTAQGIPFIHSGQEFCRSKGGNHNSYNAGDAVNRIDWSLKKANRDVFEYYRGLIALRKAHPVFRLPDRMQINRRFQFARIEPTEKCIAFTLDGRALSGETFDQVLVLLNGEDTDQTFVLPDGRWSVYADADKAGTQPIAEAANQVMVVGHSGMVLAR